MPGDVEQFAQDISEIGVIPAGLLENLLEQIDENDRPRTRHDLLALLQQRKILTSWQAQQLAQGAGPALVLDDYLLLDRIGAGGMGEVFKAEHRRMERVVALKVLRATSVESAEALERFLQEMRAAARLVHPNIVTAYDAGEATGRHFLVMEFVEGCDLATLVRRRPVEVDEAIDYILQAARGLQYAHDRGVVHRDIKPGNLLRDAEGVIKILDMGIARLDRSAPHGAADETETQLTEAGVVMGTVDFMAPEQAMNLRNADARSDIYSLGCTLFFLLAGKPAYHGETVVEKIFAHRDIPVPLLRKARPDAPEALDAICSRMMAKDPDQRFQQMSEVVEALEQALSTAEPAFDVTERIVVEPPRSNVDGPTADQATKDSSTAGSAMTGPAITGSPTAGSPTDESIRRAVSGDASAQPAAMEKLRRFIEGCGGADKFLDYEEEQTIFRRGGELELALSDVERLLDECCAGGRWTRQSKLTEELTEKLHAAAQTGGAIDQAEYEAIIGHAVSRRMPRKLAEEHCLTLILDNGWRPQQGLFNRWFDRKRRRYGLE